MPAGRARKGSNMMDDKEIIELYWHRDEAGIRETDVKYGKLCRYVTKNILISLEDCEECVNDTYLACWNAIPPKQPDKLSAFVSRIARNLALNRWDYLTAEKRNPGAVCSLEELEECVSGAASVESVVLEKEIEMAVSDFLWKQEEEKRNIFMRRYWYFDSIEEISRMTGFSAGRIKSVLFRMRGKLKAYLEKEGIVV